MFKKFNVLLILSIFLLLPANAKLVQLECLSGDCSQALNVDDLDLNKVLSSTVNSSLSLVLDPKSLLVNNNYTNSFKVIVYEVDGAGNKNIFASSDVSLPNNARKLKTLPFSVKVEPFLGQKELHFAVHKVDGTLLATYQGLYNFTGTVNETNSGFSPNNTDNVGAEDESPRVVCTSENFNECNLDSLFFNRIQFEVDQKKQSQNVNIRKSSDGIYKISLPAILSNAVNSQAAVATVTTNPTSVNTTHLVDKSVTEAKLADDSITDVKVAAIDAAKIKTGTLDVARIPALGIDKITGLQERLSKIDIIFSQLNILSATPSPAPKGDDPFTNPNPPGLKVEYIDPYGPAPKGDDPFTNPNPPGLKVEYIDPYGPAPKGDDPFTNPNPPGLKVEYIDPYGPAPKVRIDDPSTLLTDEVKVAGYNDDLAKVVNVTADYVLTGEESGYTLEINSESAMKVIIPAGLTQGFQVEIVNITGVPVSFISTSENLLSFEGRTQLSGAFSSAKLRKRVIVKETDNKMQIDNQWILIGDLLLDDTAILKNCDGARGPSSL
jgi:hypothetical protein